MWRGAPPRTGRNGDRSSSESCLSHPFPQQMWPCQHWSRAGGQSPTRSARDLQCLEPAGCRPRAQAKPGPELCLRAFVGLREPVHGNAGNWPGYHGVGTPLLPEVLLAIQAWVNRGLWRGSLPLWERTPPHPRKSELLGLEWPADPVQVTEAQGGWGSAPGCRDRVEANPPPYPTRCPQEA